MSPEYEIQDPFSLASSPLPTYPNTRRPSVADSVAVGSSAANWAHVTRVASFQSGVSEISESVFSETSAAPFAEIDRRLEQFVLQTEPDAFKKGPAANIPTEIPQELRQQPYGFSCAFGWTGDEKVDIGDMPTTKAAFQAKLVEAKEGSDFILTSLQSYRLEINSRRHHKFNDAFLGHQNTAIMVTMDQLEQINKKVNEVVAEVNALDDKDTNIKEELIEAYKHAAPWIKRTRRVVHDAHVFYKLNYTMGAMKKAGDKKKTHVSTLETAETATDTKQVDIAAVARNGNAKKVLIDEGDKLARRSNIACCVSDLEIDQSWDL